MGLGLDFSGGGEVFDKIILASLVLGFLDILFRFCCCYLVGHAQPSRAVLWGGGVYFLADVDGKAVRSKVDF